MSNPDPIKIDWSTVDWTASTGQASTETLMGDIRWFWPYIKITPNLFEPITHIIPIEYRVPTEEEINAFYPGLRGWNFTNVKMIFYREVFSNEKSAINYCAPYRFFSEFKPEEE